MKEPLWARLEIPLNTSRENIWNALTLPELTQKYMYNCRLNCSWGLESPANWEEVFKDGTSTTHVKGELIEYTPFERLRFKIFHSRKILKNHVSELRFSLQHHEIGVLLVVEQGDFSSFPQAKEFYSECVQSWNYIQNDLKSTCLLTP